MNFEQPQGVPTKAEIDATIDALRVQISDKQAEIVRQQTIIDSNRYTTQQLSNEKADLTDQVEKLKTVKTNLEKDIDGLAKQKETTQAQVDEARKEVAQKASEMEIAFL